MGSHAKSKLPQFLICFRDLPRRSDNDFGAVGVDDTIIVKLRRDTIPHMARDGKNLIVAKYHWVFREIHDRIVKCLNAALKNTDGDTCQIANRCTQIL